MRPDLTGPAPERDAVTVRVLVADTDMMGMVYNGNYLVWFELGRTEWLRRRGLAYAEVERRGFSLPVTEASFRIRRPARYDDLLRIETEAAGLRSRGLTFVYRILREGEVLVEGETRHILTAHDGGRPATLPAWLRRHLVAT